MTQESSTIISSPDWSRYLIRHDELVASRNAFIDTRTPGSDKKENFCLIGPGVAEDPNQYVHIRIPHGFNIGGARQPPGCRNSHHSHETAEVFVVHGGRWKFTWGADGSDGAVVLEPGDTISIPVRVFRGFENVGDDDGFLFSVLGGDDPGFVTWAPYVFENASRYGMVLLDDGRLIDTANGGRVPQGARRQAPPSPDEVDAFRRMSFDEMRACVVARDELHYDKASPLAAVDGVREAPVIGPASDGEKIGAGKMAWLHGFHVRRVGIDSGCAIPAHRRHEREVVFVHDGRLEVRLDGVAQVLGPGDVVTVPIGMTRQFASVGDDACDLVVVRGGDAPAPPDWVR